MHDRHPPRPRSQEAVVKAASFNDLLDAEQERYASRERRHARRIALYAVIGAISGGRDRRVGLRGGDQHPPRADPVAEAGPQHRGGDQAALTAGLASRSVRDQAPEHVVGRGLHAGEDRVLGRQGEAEHGGDLVEGHDRPGDQRAAGLECVGLRLQPDERRGDGAVGADQGRPCTDIETGDSLPAKAMPISPGSDVSTPLSMIEMLVGVGADMKCSVAGWMTPGSCPVPSHRHNRYRRLGLRPEAWHSGLDGYP